MSLESAGVVSSLPHGDGRVVIDLSHVEGIVGHVYVPDFPLADPRGSLPDQEEAELVGIFSKPCIVEPLCHVALRMDMDAQQVPQILRHHQVGHDHLVSGAADGYRDVLDREVESEYLGTVEHFRAMVDVKDTLLLFNQPDAGGCDKVIDGLPLFILKDHLDLVEPWLIRRPERRIIDGGIEFEHIVIHRPEVDFPGHGSGQGTVLGEPGVIIDSQ